MPNQQNAMIAGQIMPNRVNDPRIIEAFEAVPRDVFTPGGLREVAYVDEDLEIAPGRYLIEPMVLARMIAAVNPGKDDMVLDIGCGTGYSTAILARLVNVVVGVEENHELAEAASEALGELETGNAAVIEGPLGEGCPKQAPFEVIVISGGVAFVPDVLFDQLADGGRLVAVLMGKGIGRATVFTRTGKSFSGRVAFDAHLPLLPGFEKPEGFSF